MGHVANGDYEMVGTFNGNPLAMAATRAMLDRGGHHIGLRPPRPPPAASGDRPGTNIADYGLDAHVVAVGAKGCVVFRREPVRDYRGFSALDDRYNHAHWLIQHNGGVFLPPWGKTEQWLISTQHDDADIDRFLANFGRLARRHLAADPRLHRMRPATGVSTACRLPALRLDGAAWCGA